VQFHIGCGVFKFSVTFFVLEAMAMATTGLDARFLAHRGKDVQNALVSDRESVLSTISW